MVVLWVDALFVAMIFVLDAFIECISCRSNSDLEGMRGTCLFLSIVLLDR